MKTVRNFSLTIVALVVAGCASAPQSGGVNDPLEPMNRTFHGVNKGLDTVALKPASQVYGTVVPDPVRKGVNNVADTLSLPATIANDMLQADLAGAVTNTLRLGVNLTFGLAGTIDFASAAGMPKKSNDFGTTLAKWGVGEGPYVELPLLGPSTLRDAIGTGVDLASDPVGNVFEGDDADAATAASVLSRLDDRYRYSNTVDDILYGSADSYAQLRLLYLQNRRFELGQESTADDDLIDPYEDPYAE